jgi:hypothetical protein
MKLLARVVAHLVFVCSLIVFFVLPRNKYEWMQAIDSSISASQIESESRNSIIFTLFFLIIVIVTQLGLAATTSSKNERIASLALASLAIGFWLLWYWE